MTINFLELTPKPATEIVALETAGGPVELELSGLSLSTLSDLARRFPAFGRIIEGGGGTLVSVSEAMPALIAAGLGHPGSEEYEQKASTLGAADMLMMVRVVMRLTLPQDEGPVPLPDPALLNGAAGEAPELTLPPSLSN